MRPEVNVMLTYRAGPILDLKDESCAKLIDKGKSWVQPDGIPSARGFSPCEFIVFLPGVEPC
jgi:hypothetical protein